MAGHAYIKLVPLADKENVTTEEIKELFEYYKSITAKTGDQLDWNYHDSAFPYEIKEKPDAEGKWFYLYSNHDRYHSILLGVDKETVVENDNEREQSYIQVSLSEASTFGDKGKANEFCKFLAKKLKAELHLFNGRIMYYYPRK
ncbi:hypothetical protein CVD25_12960 [Bacillus canaveralius]|uniref:Uncharacterized protein n=1 Tax=Bacillus canaveralius TaxID=1403243 RepID=A0A2N5GNH9_9BACI|nr:MULTISPECIES: DUF1885 family protein [Bacillus]PLR84054.1 hypothetical protein CU635_07045 [Bacillus canaveralius]PLR87287.1 hypothetical protein CVD23_03520 [Bacillus sp. V33-4]PLR96300.1 hypothetical protein CVD25_12960 [Bacillus canaveralius]RSK53513.1 DUF1885 family protein [Bacillus canaveralius]